MWDFDLRGVAFAYTPSAPVHFFLASPGNQPTLYWATKQGVYGMIYGFQLNHPKLQNYTTRFQAKESAIFRSAFLCLLINNTCFCSVWAPFAVINDTVTPRRGLLASFVPKSGNVTLRAFIFDVGSITAVRFFVLCVCLLFLAVEFVVIFMLQQSHGLLNVTDVDSPYPGILLANGNAVIGFQEMSSGKGVIKLYDFKYDTHACSFVVNPVCLQFGDSTEGTIRCA